MILTRTKSFYSCAMRLGGVTFVFVPLVVRVFIVNLIHIFIPNCFGQYGSCSNIHEFAITLDYSLMWYSVERFESVSVHRDKLWFNFEFRYGLMHGQNGSIENIDFIDCFWMNMCNPIANRVFFNILG